MISLGLRRWIDMSPTSPMSRPSPRLGFALGLGLPAPCRGGGGGGGGRTGALSYFFRTSSNPGGGIVLPTPDQLRTTNGVLHTGRRNHTATLLPGGAVLIAGGIVVGTTVTATCERYNPAGETFTQ